MASAWNAIKNIMKKHCGTVKIFVRRGLRRAAWEVVPIAAPEAQELPLNDFVQVGQETAPFERLWIPSKNMRQLYAESFAFRLSPFIFKVRRRWLHRVSVHVFTFWSSISSNLSNIFQIRKIKRYILSKSPTFLLLFLRSFANCSSSVCPWTWTNGPSAWSGRASWCPCCCSSPGGKSSCGVWCHRGLWRKHWVPWPSPACHLLRRKAEHLSRNYCVYNWERLDGKFSMETKAMILVHRLEQVGSQLWLILSISKQGSPKAQLWCCHMLSCFLRFFQPELKLKESEVILFGTSPLWFARSNLRALGCDALAAVVAQSLSEASGLCREVVALASAATFAVTWISTIALVFESLLS